MSYLKPPGCIISNNSPICFSPLCLCPVQAFIYISAPPQALSFQCSDKGSAMIKCLHCLPITAFRLESLLKSCILVELGPAFPALFLVSCLYACYSHWSNYEHILFGLVSLLHFYSRFLHLCICPRRQLGRS